MRERFKGTSPRHNKKKQSHVFHMQTGQNFSHTSIYSMLLLRQGSGYDHLFHNEPDDLNFSHQRLSRTRETNGPMLRPIYLTLPDQSLVPLDILISPVVISMLITPQKNLSAAHIALQSCIYLPPKCLH